MKHLITIWLFFLLPGTASAQEHVWKKLVTRRIILDSDDASAAFIDTLANQVKKGRTHIYTLDFQELSFDRTRRILVIDSANELRSQLMKTHYYDVLEEWTLDPQSCNMDIQILAISPLRSVYMEDSYYRGRESIFWIKYRDIGTILVQFLQRYPSNNMLNAIWNGYFRPNQYADSNLVKLNKVSTILEMKETDDTIAFHLRNWTWSIDTSMMRRLANRITQGGILAYPPLDSDLRQPMSENEKAKVFDPETYATVDPVELPDAPELIPTPEPSNWIFDHFTSIKILQEWTFKCSEGKTEIIIPAVAIGQKRFRSDGSYREYENILWVHFDDFKNLLPAYEVYHPINTFAEKLWQSYFQTPEYVH